jgi:carbonic anhydrase/acetyltransferase-like protein (isoleucine patch superfamily)
VSIDPSAFVHSEAFVCGDVTLGPRASVWPGAVIRADSAAITVGESSNVQDGVIMHVDPGLPCTVGARVTIGHRAVVHGATVEDDCLIGIGAIVLNRVVVGRGSLVGAGAVCSEGMVIPPGSLVLGIPGRVVRAVDDVLRNRIAAGVAAYVALAEQHRRGEFARCHGRRDDRQPQR